MNEKTKDKRESGKVRRRIRSKSKHCYQNAFRVIFEVPEYANAD